MGRAASLTWRPGLRLFPREQKRIGGSFRGRNFAPSDRPAPPIQPIFSRGADTRIVHRDSPSFTEISAQRVVRGGGDVWLMKIVGFTDTSIRRRRCLFFFQLIQNKDFQGGNCTKGLYITTLALPWPSLRDGLGLSPRPQHQP